MHIFIFCFISYFSSLLSVEIPSQTHLAPPPLKEQTVTTTNTVKINGHDIAYTATVGTQVLNDDKGNPKASIFYIAYTKDSTVINERPITFCFNGGPGSSSVWLHLGVFGPKRVNIDEEGLQASLPYHLLDNPYSILDMTDLVFIDPVSTGYSKAARIEDSTTFHSLDADIQSVAEFIRLYVTRNERWESPKLLAGESYGTTRAAGVALELHHKNYMFLNGILLISPVLNFQTISFASSNDLAYILYLSTYTSTALYHKKLLEPFQKNPKETIEKVNQFALREYAEALLLGNNMDSHEKIKIIEKISDYTGLSKEYIEQSNLRIDGSHFAKELLRSNREIIGRFDSRYKGIGVDGLGMTSDSDPSFDTVLGLFTATFNDYVRRELGWKTDEEYKILADVNPWTYGSATNKYLDVSDRLREIMSVNTKLQVYVACGMYDLATPCSATDYTISHLDLVPALNKNMTLHHYEGGHMMYLKSSTLLEMKKDISLFINQATK